MQHSFIRPIDNKGTALMDLRQQNCTVNVFDIASSCTALINLLNQLEKLQDWCIWQSKQEYSTLVFDIITCSSGITLVYLIKITKTAALIFIISENAIGVYLAQLAKL